MQDNVLILGGPASGKTRACRQMVAGMVAAGGRAVALDWHGDYSDLSKELGKDRVITIGTGEYNEASSSWLARQIARITNLLSVNLVVVECDVYPDEVSIQNLLLLARKTNTCGGQLVVTAQAVQPFSTPVGRELVNRMQTIKLLRMSEQDIEKAKEIFKLSMNQSLLLLRGEGITIKRT